MYTYDILKKSLFSDVVGIKPEVSVSSSVRPNGDEVDLNISWILQVKL